MGVWLFGWLQVDPLASARSPQRVAVHSEALATMGKGHHRSSSVKADYHQGLHLSSPPHLPDTLEELSPPGGSQRAEQSPESDRPSLKSKRAHMLLRRAGDRDKLLVVHKSLCC